MSLLAVLDPAVSLAFHAVEGLSQVIPTSLAIVVFTVILRLALFPLTRAATRGERASAQLAPRVAELQKRHRSDPERQRQEVTDLYRREGASPLAGCLPRLVQAPFFTVMYRLFTLSVIAGHDNVLLEQTVFAVPLGDHLFTAATMPHLLVFILIYLAIGGVAYLTCRQLRAGGPSPSAAGAPALLAKIGPLLPFGTVVVAAFLPLAGAIYLLTSTAWTYAERRVLTAAPAPA
ncbi:YidC/Oxa1 family membrane protein insertase [Leekyejoonella antrihumi]|uniref:Membrane protein insertase YidC n=1 Tax=Leekyejoonella antrihumi TaxID=1660198 RepID=A0A563DUH1_9MICO|nr:YidC/Oxa1 family membrane protein insertase [Leekyejoonella antrihumi]TWP33895.1 YidC/Oxa1 family membrane protein insertase [Leekyejoonella antrihumi]